MKILALVLGLASLATPALAQSRPSTTEMPCARAAALVASRGAIVLGTGGFTYDRFVASRAFCQPTETTRASFAPTVDSPQCFVGYRCVEPSRNRFRDD